MAVKKTSAKKPTRKAAKKAVKILLTSGIHIQKSGKTRFGEKIISGIVGNVKDVLLFGESPSRVVVSCSPKNLAVLKGVIQKYQVPFEVIGEVIEDDFIVNGDVGSATLHLKMESLKKNWEQAFESLLC